MGHIATKSNKSDDDKLVTLPPEAPALTGEQRRAIQLIASGKTVTEVARTLGRDRKTVYRWKDNPFFVAELNCQQDELLERIQNRLHRLADRAVDVLETNLEQNNLKAALELLKIINLHGNVPYVAKQTSPALVLKAQAEEKAMAAVFGQPFAEKRNVNATARELAYELASMAKEKYGVQSSLNELMDEE